MTTKNLPIVMKLSPTVDIMLQLDEPSMYYNEFVIERKRSFVIVRATQRAAKSMLSECRDRSDSFGGYSQPLSWYATARAAARRIAAALDAAKCL